MWEISAPRPPSLHTESLLDAIRVDCEQHQPVWPRKRKLAPVRRFGRRHVKSLDGSPGVGMFLLPLLYPKPRRRDVEMIAIAA